MSSSRDEILQRFLTGDLDPAGPEGREHLRADPDLERELEELLLLQQRCDRAGAAARSLAEAATEMETPRGVDVRATLDRVQEGFPLRWPRYVAAALVIAALGLGVWWWLERDEAESGVRRQEQLLGPSALRLDAPAGPGADLSLFSWTFPDRDGVVFELTVWEMAGGVRGPTLVDREKVDGRSWIARGSEAWPPTIQWELTALDASGRELATQRTEASRKP